MDTVSNATWPDLAIGLYDKLTGRGAEISYSFDALTVGVPQDAKGTPSARWTLDGTVRVSTSNREAT